MKQNIGLCLLLLLLLTYPGLADDALFNLEIQRSPEILKSGGTLDVKLILTNISQLPRTIYTGCLYPTEMLNMMGENGSNLSEEFTVIYDVMWSPVGFQTLQPEESFSWKFKAVWTEGQGLEFKSSQIRAVDSGKYVLQGVFTGWEGVTTDDNGATVPIGQALSLPDVFTGTVESGTITVIFE